MSEQQSTLLDELKRRNILKVAAAYAVAGWILLQLADVTFPGFGLDDGDIIYVMVLLAIGLPAVIAFSWLYEITPDGLKPTRRVTPEESISRYTGQRINHIIIALLTIALLFFMFEYFNRDRQPDTTNAGQAGASPDRPVADAAAEVQSVEPDVQIASEVDPEPSIAVMPFVNMSSDEENEYFSDGLSEELLNVLAQIEGLRVAGRTSSFYYKGKSKDLREIGRELDVNNILEGSVRKAGNKVRITAQLISTHDGFHLWSQTYDRELDDIFAIQDEISREVAEALQLTLLTDGVTLPESRQTSSADAHDVYLQATQLLYDRRPESIKRSIDLFKLASRLDPEYAPPYIGLAKSALIAWNNHRSISMTDSIQIAEQSFERAEELGYITSDYWATRGLYYDHLIGLDPKNQDRAKEAYEKALELNPNNGEVLHWYATNMRYDPAAPVGREAEMMKRAYKIDPHNRVVKMNYYLSMVGTEDEEDGIAALDRLAREDSEYDGYAQYLAFYYMTRSRFTEAVPYVSRLDDDNRVKFMALRWLAHVFADNETANKVMNQVSRQHPAYERLRLMAVATSGDRRQMVIEARILLNDTDYEAHADALAFGLIEQGEYELAMNIMENANPALAADSPSWRSAGPGTQRDYLAASFLGGQTQRARDFAGRLLEAYKDLPRVGMPRGRGMIFADAYMVLGDYDAALAELEAACEEGWLGLKSSGIDRSPLFEPVRDHPRYVALAERIQKDIDRQRPAIIAALDWNPLFAAM